MPESQGCRTPPVPSVGSGQTGTWTKCVTRCLIRCLSQNNSHDSMPVPEQFACPGSRLGSRFAVRGSVRGSRFAVPGSRFPVRFAVRGSVRGSRSAVRRPCCYLMPVPVCGATAPRMGTLQMIQRSDCLRGAWHEGIRPRHKRGSRSGRSQSAKSWSHSSTAMAPGANATPAGSSSGLPAPNRTHPVSGST